MAEVLIKSPPEQASNDLDYEVKKAWNAGPGAEPTEALRAMQQEQTLRELRNITTELRFLTTLAKVGVALWVVGGLVWAYVIFTSPSMLG